jgi:DNA uptake protein ComE-like DNA-binding protein
MSKIRVNLANPAELCEISGITSTQADAIVKFRADHGPIKNADQLADIIGDRSLADDVRQRLDFDPAGMTAPEAPGA